MECLIWVFRRKLSALIRETRLYHAKCCDVINTISIHIATQMLIKIFVFRYFTFFTFFYYWKLQKCSLTLSRPNITEEENEYSVCCFGLYAHYYLPWRHRHFEVSTKWSTFCWPHFQMYSPRWKLRYCYQNHYDDVIMSTIASQITSLTIVYSTVYSSADQSKHQSSASLAFVWEIHRGPVNFPHKWPVTRKMFPFDDVIMFHLNLLPRV